MPRKINTKKRNRYAGKSPSYKKKGMSKKAIANKRKYDSEYQKSPARVKYRQELNNKRRALIKKGKVKRGDKKDVGHKVSHKKGGTLKKGYRVESRKKNRGRK